MTDELSEFLQKEEKKIPCENCEGRTLTFECDICSSNDDFNDGLVVADQKWKEQVEKLEIITLCLGCFVRYEGELYKCENCGNIAEKGDSYIGFEHYVYLSDIETLRGLLQ